MKKILCLIVCTALCALLLSAGCTQDATSPAPATPAGSAAPVTPTTTADSVKTLSTSLGTVLTDSRGMTLYYFAPDIPGSGKSTCYGGCANAWPVFYVDSPTVSPPLAGADFSFITRTDGTKQTSYKGWPLYYFSRDEAAGDTRGESVQGNWSAVKPDYNVMYSWQPGYGTFLTDGSGRTLYFFARENPMEAACTGTCLTNWPPYSSGPLVAPSLLKSGDFSVTTRPDGIRQSLYKDRLLYSFVKDTKPGDMFGQGVNNAWYVANISGYVPPVPTLAPTAVPTTKPTINYGSDTDSGGGGGY
nr:hypothetical protein [uncultured Methanoregula sp.]